MRIGVDIRALDTNYTTGIDTYLSALLEQWLKNSRGHIFFLLGTKSLSGNKLVLNYLKEGHEFVAHAWSPKVFNSSLRFLKRPHLDQVGHTDVFFLPHPMFHAFSPQALTVITFHDLSYERLSSVYSNKHNLWHWFVNPSGEARRASRVIAVSESTSRDLQQQYLIPEEKIDVVPLGISLETAVSDAEDFNIPDPYILYLGSIEPRKNVLALVQAFEILRKKRPGLKLVLAGSFFPQRDEKVIKRVSGSESIILTGKVSEEQKSRLYQRARVLVLPSFYEGFGLQILESMAAGTPVVTAAATSMPEVAAGAALLVNPLNPTHLTRAIDSLIDDSALRTSVVQRGKAVADLHSWQKTAAETLDILEKTVYNTK